MQKNRMMEFWGVEVKSGETLNCDPGFGKYLHISQATLGEIQNAKENERVRLYVHASAREFLIGTLAYGKCDQISLDIVFDKEFKLSHSCTKGSVFFCGYTTVVQGDEVSGSDEEGSLSESSDSESEDAKQAQALKHTLKENGKAEAKPARLSVITSGATPAKAEAGTLGKAGKNAKEEEVKAVGEKSTDEDEGESEDEDDDDDEEMGDSSDEDGSDESGDDSDENNNEKKAEPAAKKRPLPDSATKSFAIEKKTKVTAPGGVQKTGIGGGKKGESKMLGGKPGLSVKPQTPSAEVQTSKVKGTPDAKVTPKPNAKPGTEKKVGVHTCVPCSRNFATESALNQHNNAKHKSN